MSLEKLSWQLSDEMTLTRSEWRVDDRELPAPSTPAQNAVEPKRPWRLDAACAGMPLSMFYEAPELGGAYVEARQVCGACPVRTECLEDALLTGEVKHGFRGGMTPYQRQVEARNRRRELLRRECEWCREMFESARLSIRYCSEECRNAIRSARMRRSRGSAPRLREVSCRVCGVVFHPTHKGRASYCSAECRVAGERERWREHKRAKRAA